MLAKVNRFHGHNSIRPLFQKGAPTRSAYVKLLTLPARYHEPRIAVVVSKKVAKSAVVRNRIRRRLYELVRRYRLQHDRPYDVVCIVNDSALADLPANELQDYLYGLLQKIR